MTQGNPELIRLLSDIDPKKPYGKDLFNALARVTVSAAIEAVCIRINPETKIIEVYLTQRASDDCYPCQWHCPGSVMRPGEEIRNVFTRLENNEFLAKLKWYQFVGHYNNTEEERGHFISLIYFCKFEENGIGKWFSVNDLPSNTIIHHRNEIIPIALRYFLTGKQII